MKNESLLFSGSFMFKGPEGGPDREVKAEPRPVPEGETHGYDMRSPETDGAYESYGEWQVTIAEQAALARGQELTEEQRGEIRLAAKLELNKWNAQARELSEFCFNGAPVFPCEEPESVGEMLTTQGTMPDALGIEGKASAEGLYPGLENLPIKRGQFLVILDGGKRIQVVGISDEANKLGVILKEDVRVLSKGERNEKIYAGVMRVKDRFTMTADGRIEFKNPIAEKKTTLGQMFKEDAIVVDGRLVVKGDDSEYHRVVEKRGGAAVLAKQRVYVKTGTTVEKDISQNPAYVALVKKVKGIEEADA